MKNQKILLITATLLHIGNLQASIIGHAAQTAAPVTAQALAVAIPQIRGYITNTCIKRQQAKNNELAKKCDYLDDNFDWFAKDAEQIVEENKELLNIGMQKLETMKKLQAAYNQSKDNLDRAFTISDTRKDIYYDMNTGLFSTPNDRKDWTVHSKVGGISFKEEQMPQEQKISDLNKIKNQLQRSRNRVSNDPCTQAFLQPHQYLTKDQLQAFKHFHKTMKDVDQYYASAQEEENSPELLPSAPQSLL